MSWWTISGRVLPKIFSASQWHYTQYSAWCGNNGKYSTRLLTADWNAQIIWKMRMELAYQWEIVIEEIDALFNTLLAAIEEQFDAVEYAFSNAPMAQQIRHQLLSGFRPRLEGCKYAVTRAKEEFAHEVTILRRYLSESGPGSFILDAMIPAYRTASKIYGMTPTPVWALTTTLTTHQEPERRRIRETSLKAGSATESSSPALPSPSRRAWTCFLRIGGRF
ncbi:uncharacterized protein B0H64DRAFT_242135 [Chaetomium fimeti]|uniref:DUF7605 domain-containing protein n=1 Tax=Chaetomium fimeti TaxID=1854472 RepID=A0AAE0LND8_9PEZI|nr:hypothetical protein B0H64DRAFT_242135 [Chaetomium fimeti]